MFKQILPASKIQNTWKTVMRNLVLILGLKGMCNYLLFTWQVFLAKNKQEDQFYAIKVLNKAAIRKRNEVR